MSSFEFVHANDQTTGARAIGFAKVPTSELLKYSLDWLHLGREAWLNLYAGGLSGAHQQGLLLASPVVACLFVTMAVVVILMKTSPQINLFSFGMPVRLGMGLFALFLLLPDMVYVFSRILRQADHVIYWFAS